MDIKFRRTTFISTDAKIRKNYVAMADLTTAIMDTAKQRIRWLINDMQQSILCVYDPMFVDELTNDALIDICCFVSRCSYAIGTMPETLSLLMDNTGFIGEPGKWVGEEQVKKLCEELRVRLDVLHTEIVLHNELKAIQELLNFEY